MRVNICRKAISEWHQIILNILNKLTCVTNVFSNNAVSNSQLLHSDDGMVKLSRFELSGEM